MTTNIATDEFPYQIVAMFGRSPRLGEKVYSGKDGWYPQVTLKRRFGLRTLTENELLARIAAFARSTSPFTVEFGDTSKGRLPIKVIEVTNGAPKQFHRDLLKYFGRKIGSRYPDREGGAYYPHMTIEWNGRPVVNAGHFIHTAQPVQKIWLLKDDVSSDDSRAFASFELSH